MSFSATAIFRPLRGQCLQQTRSGVLSLQVKTPSASIRMRAIIALPPQQTRYQSSSNDRRNNKHSSNELQKGPSRKPMTFSKFVRVAMAQALRNTAVALSPSGLRAAFRERPVGLSFALFALFVVAVIAVQVGMFFYNTFYNDYYSVFPPEIANSLRRAIYHTKYKPDPELALKYYKKALRQCEEQGLDPYSNEVLGIRLQIVTWLETVHNWSASITVLQGIQKDCLKWIEVMEKSVTDGQVDANGYYKSLEKKPATDEEKGSPANEQKPETLWHKRQRLLQKAVGISLKLGETYASEHVLQPEESHSHLVWAVETSLKEFKRRKDEGPHPGEDKWQSAEELGSSLESLGRGYERRNQFHLAIPLFFQALRLCESPCHRAVIMNNLSASFAQHPLFVPMRDGAVADSPDALKELFDTSMPTTRKESLEAGMNWARNAYQHAKDVKGDARTVECDEACAVSLCNWGDVAAMLGKVELAKKKYQQCIEMSTSLGFEAGITQARKGLAKLTTAPLVKA